MNSAIHIRPERKEDLPAIWHLTKAAFAGKPYADGDEQDLIDRLRHMGALTLSLVAEQDKEILGQITFSPARIENSSGPWFALGPVSVVPARQSEGIGAALIHAGLSETRQMGALGCILTGNPVYYQRFGFEVSPDLAPPNEPGEFFMLKLLGGTRPDAVFSFHPTFYAEE